MREKGYGWGLLSYSVFSARLDTLNCSRGTTMTVTEGAPSLTADPPPVAPPVRLRAPGSAPSPASKWPAGRWPAPARRGRACGGCQEAEIPSRPDELPLVEPTGAAGGVHAVGHQRVLVHGDRM